MALLTRMRFISALIAGLGQVAAMSGAEAQAPLEPGRISDGQLAGLFYQVAVASVGPRRVDTRTWLFLPGQRVSRVYPFGSVFDPSRCSADTCGSFWVVLLNAQNHYLMHTEVSVGTQCRLFGSSTRCPWP